jgi:putative molybdopterin biosynthesis protein
MQFKAGNFMEAYLNTEQAAAYLGIKERKLYELVAEGAVPCSKVTGKWLFPRRALDRWVELGLSRPAGLVLEVAPPIVGGSHDPLLEWALRQSGSGLALLSEGSLAGFRKLEENRVGLAAVHLHGPEPQANIRAVEQSMHLPDGVLIAFAEREQGLLLAPGNPKGIASLADLVERQARLGLRQPGAGAQQLAEQLFGKAGLNFADATQGMPIYPTGGDLAYAIRSGEVDAGIATRAAAKAQGLDFVPLAWERFDLALRRRSYFEPGPQKLFTLMRSTEFARRADELTGYRVADAGIVRFNR